METSLSPILMCLTALTAIGAVAVYPRPYNRICNRASLLPRFLTAVVDETYNPTDEARRTLSAFLALSAACAVACALMPEAISLQGLCMLYAGMSPAYFLHRCFCLHKMNFSTPYTVAARTNALTVHRTWLVALVWLLTVGSALSANCGILPMDDCNAVPIFLSVAALVFTLYETGHVRRYFRGIRDEYRPGFMDFAPYSYYALATLTGTALTQCAVYTANPLWLVTWAATLLAFLLFDYRIRLCSDNGINGFEDWNLPHVPNDEEARRLYRKGLRAMFGNKGTCWLLITRDEDGTHTRAELSCDMGVKCNEIIFEHRTLLYVCAYPDIPSAFVAFRKVEHDDAMCERLISGLNPGRRNLVLLPLNELETMNKCDNPFKLYENEKKDA